MATAKAVSTIGTVLKYGTSADSLTKLCKIKSYPDLGGAPDQIESTDLEDTSQTFVPGVQSQDAMEFTANYNLEDFTKLKTTEGQEGYYQLEFGNDGADGVFSWQGQHYAYVNGGDVNAVREMTISITASTSIAIGEAATAAFVAK